jgi:hypothetical protein
MTPKASRAALRIAMALGVFFGCWAKTGSEVHLIPVGYVGVVVILYGVPNGEIPRRSDDGVVTYAVGGDGFLAVSDPAPPAGFYDTRYYYVSTAGSRSEIPYEGEAGSLQIFAAVDGVTGSGPAATRWASYVVGVPAEHNDWAELRDQAVERAVARARQQRSKEER